MSRYDSDLEAFRADVRALLESRLPDALRALVAKGGYPPFKQLKSWNSILAERGWLTPTWPVEYGGAGLRQHARAILDEELAHHDAPPLEGIGLGIAGPAIMAFGSKAQKARFLPPISRAEEFWCQGFSEPGSGSDLASLSTKAVRDGDEFVIDGSKIWTSEAHEADWMFGVFRTDPGAPKHKGISALLLDMKSPGVTVRPIRWMNGVHGYNEVFFDSVRVPAENLLGEENGGWKVALGALGPERIFVSRVGENKRLLRRLRKAMEERGENGRPLAEDPEFSGRAARLEIRFLAMEERFLRFLDRLEETGEIGPDVAMLKLTGSTMLQNFEQLITEAYGAAVLPFDPERIAAEGLGLEVGPPYAAMAAMRQFHHRGYSIAAGSSEVQRDVIARRVLNM